MHHLVSFNTTGNVTRSGDPFLNNPNLRGFDYTIQVLRTVLCIASFLGNAIIVIIMSRQKNRGQQTSIIFTALAISDTLVTIFGPLRLFLYVGFGFEYFSWTMYDGGLYIVTISSVVQISSWLLTLITIERVVCVAIPHRVNDIISVRVVTISVLVIVLFFPLFNSVFIFSTYIHEDRKERGFTVFYPRELIYGYIDQWTEMLFKCLIPLAVIVPSNAFIIYKLVCRNSALTRSTNRTVQSVTKNVVIVCIVFAVTLSPRQILNGLVCGKYLVMTEDNMLTLFKMFIICEYFQNCNAAINFYVYVLAGSKFRNDFLKLMTYLIQCCLQRPR